jgi:DNA mismatch endonuclease (patch repair protein)
MHGCPNGRVKPKTNADFWERKRQRTAERDREKLTALKRLGWRVRVVWECDIVSGAFRRELRRWLSTSLTKGI